MRIRRGSIISSFPWSPSLEKSNRITLASIIEHTKENNLGKYKYHVQSQTIHHEADDERECFEWRRSTNPRRDDTDQSHPDRGRVHEHERPPGASRNGWHGPPVAAGYPQKQQHSLRVRNQNEIGSLPKLQVCRCGNAGFRFSVALIAVTKLISIFYRKQYTTLDCTSNRRKRCLINATTNSIGWSFVTASISTIQLFLHHSFPSVTEWRLT